MDSDCNSNYLSDYNAIKKVFEEDYPNNVRTENREAYGQMYTKDALWMAPDVIDRCGIPDILEGFDQTIKGRNINPTFTAEKIEFMGDFGYVLGIANAIIGGEPSNRAKFRALWLMKKEDGQWKIYHQIWNKKPLDVEKGKMSTQKYHQILEDYFNAFATKDFSKVQFSSKVEFLSPISGNTFKGPEAVINFVSGVSTRVSKVNILSTTVEYPQASGVWQMETTKGILYTLHNFFRLDEEGIVYVWPMFDPKAILEHPEALIPWLTGNGY